MVAKIFDQYNLSYNKLKSSRENKSKKVNIPINGGKMKTWSGYFYESRSFPDNVAKKEQQQKKAEGKESVFLLT